MLLLVALPILMLSACSGNGGKEYRLVFYSDRDGDSDIYTMDTKGENVQQLTNDPGRDYEAKASADGSMLVFGSQRAGGENGLLYLMDVDGSNVRPLTKANGGQTNNDEYPDWSPDGRRVVFQRVTRPIEGAAESDLWLVDIETGTESQLTNTPGVWDSTPSFGSDGESVLFESNRNGGDFELYRLRLDDMQVSPLTESKGIEAEAKESPDAQRVAFASERDGDFEVYLMNRDGSDIRQLTNNDAAERCPQWSPDGKRISFVSDRDGNQEIYVMKSDGSDQRRVTNSPGADEVPDWIALR
jgi:Tol biopolymer transport system component